MKVWPSAALRTTASRALQPSDTMPMGPVVPLAGLQQHGLSVAKGPGELGTRRGAPDRHIQRGRRPTPALAPAQGGSLGFPGVVH